MRFLVLLITFSNSVGAIAAINWPELDALSRQKSAESAVNKIKSLYEQGPLEPRTQVAIHRVADKIFDTFYTDKALNYYEVGKHLSISDPRESLITLAKGLEIEPYNGKLFLLWARVALMRGECNVKEKTEKLLEVYPQVDELYLLVGQDWACQEKEMELQAWLNENEDLNGSLKKYLLHLWVRLSALRKDEPQMRTYLSILARVDDKFSELEYWQSELEKTNLERKQELADKYVAACSNMSEKSRRDKLIEPLTCLAAREMKGRKKNG